jgi:hypothetical protein
MITGSEENFFFTGARKRGRKRGGERFWEKRG